MLFITQVYPDCTSAGQVDPRVGTPPAHGAVEFTPMDDYPNFVSSNPRAKCNDRRFPGVGVFHTSNPAFRGADEFTVIYVNGEGDRRVIPFHVVTD